MADPSSATAAFRELWQADLEASAGPDGWLWDGYLVAGGVTLLTSPWKAGKTTLTAALLSRMRTGGDLAGSVVRPGKALVLSEESAALWHSRQQRFTFGPHVCWLCRPFRGKPTQAQWEALLAHVADLHARHAFALLVIDPLAAFLPGRAENDAAAVLAALLALQPLTTKGLAVLLLHHPRKRASADGQWARGSGAMAGHVDVLLEMHYYSPASADDRRRKLLGYSRYDATPRRRVIELNAAGTGFDSRGDPADEEYRRGRPTLMQVLGQAERKLTRAELLAAWPPEEQAPGATTLWRWLEETVAESAVQRDGQGTKDEPFRYWLRSQEAKWRAVPWSAGAEQAAADEARRYLGRM